MALRVGYFASETFINLRRNLLMTIAAITTVWISLSLLGGMMLLGEIGNHAFSKWEGQVELSVFLRDSITPDQQKELESAISAMPEVRKVFFESKAQAFEEYKRMFEDQPSLVQHVSPDALPASYRIKLKDPNSIEAIKSRLVGRPGVEEVNFGGDVVKRFLRVAKLFRTIFLVLIAVLLGAATILIANTIRLAVYARRKEIGIMKLVGATNWFIRVPFIFEGVFEAALGAVLATGVILAAKVGIDQLALTNALIPVSVDGQFVLKVFGSLLGTGIVIGALGSSVALRRFLEV